MISPSRARPAAFVLFALCVVGCSSGASRATQRTPTVSAATTSTTRAAAVRVTTPRSTSTTAPTTIQDTFELGAFSRSGPWSAEVTEQRVTGGRQTPIGSTDYRSFDGEHWSALPVAPGMTRFVDARHGWALATDPNLDLSLSSTEDGGRHYTALGIVAGPLFHAGDTAEGGFVDDTHGFRWESSLVAEGWGLERTSDGGRTWQQVASNRADVAASFGTPANFEFVNAHEGYAVGMTEVGKPPADSGLGYSADLYRTDDGGTTWRRYGPAIAGPHAAGLPTVIGGAVDVPVVRFANGAKTLELWAGSRGSTAGWHVTAAVPMTGRDLVSGAAMNQPVAVFLDANDAVAVDGKQMLAVSAGKAPRHASLVGPYVSGLAVANGLVYADMHRGLFVSADGGFTWKLVKLPTP